jgi:hypothetical protein
MTKKSYRVSFDVTSRHTFRVPDCNSPEEAEAVAEEWFADGESGDIDETDIDAVDVVEDDGSEDN